MRPCRRLCPLLAFELLLPRLDLGGGDGLLAARAGRLITDRLTGRWDCIGRGEGLAARPLEYDWAFVILPRDRLRATGSGMPVRTVWLRLDRLT